MAKILVAEPSITMIKVIELTLGEHTVLAADSPARARELLEQHPDLAIVATHFPDGNGYDLARGCVNDRFHGCPVILLRGGFEPFDEEQARDAGVAEVLIKPFRPEELEAAVARVLKA